MDENLLPGSAQLQPKLQMAERAVNLQPWHVSAHRTSLSKSRRCSRQREDSSHFRHLYIWQLSTTTKTTLLRHRSRTNPSKDETSLGCGDVGPVARLLSRLKWTAV